MDKHCLSDICLSYKAHVKKIAKYVMVHFFMSLFQEKQILQKAHGQQELAYGSTNGINQEAKRCVDMWLKMPGTISIWIRKSVELSLTLSLVNLSLFELIFTSILICASSMIHFFHMDD